MLGSGHILKKNMKNQIIHTLVISAAILGAGFVIGTIVKDKPQAVTEAKPAPASKQTEPVQVVEDESNNELIKELVIANDELKKKVAEQNLKISKYLGLTDAYRKLRNSLSSEMRLGRVHKENFQMMANYVRHIRKLDFGYGIVAAGIGAHRNHGNVKGETEFLGNRIKTLKSTVMPPREDGPVEIAVCPSPENKLLSSALEFRLALVQSKLMVEPHPEVGIALRQQGKNGRLVPFDGMLNRPTIASPILNPATGGIQKPPTIDPRTGLPSTTGLPVGAGGGLKAEPPNNKSNKK